MSILNIWNSNTGCFSWQAMFLCLKYSSWVLFLRNEKLILMYSDKQKYSWPNKLSICFCFVEDKFLLISNKTVFPGSNSQLWLCYFTGANRSQTPLLSNLKVLLTYEWSFKETGIRFLSKPVSVPSFWYCSIIYSFGIAFWVRRVLLLITFLTE